MAAFHTAPENSESFSTSLEEAVENAPEIPAEPEETVELDELGRRKYDENGEKIHWATKSQRVTAWVLAILVILITLAYAYSISTGDLFFR